MDAERASNSVHKLSGTTVIEELIDSPFHSNHGLNSVSGRDVNLAALGEVELEDVFDTNISVFTTETSFDLSIHAYSFVPLVHVDSLSVHNDLSRLSTWIGNSDNQLHGVILGCHRVHLLLWRRSSVYNIICSSFWQVYKNWEAAETCLSSIETVPDMVHETIDFITDSSALQLRIHRLNRAIQCIRIFTLE